MHSWFEGRQANELYLCTYLRWSYCWLCLEKFTSMQIPNPTIYWRDCILFCSKVIYESKVETCEIKGHYLNATAGTCEEIIKRFVFAWAYFVRIFGPRKSGICAWKKNRRFNILWTVWSQLLLIFKNRKILNGLQ